MESNKQVTVTGTATVQGNRLSSTHRDANREPAGLATEHTTK
jgi:hypothetical protein